MANWLISVLLELKWSTIKKNRYFLHKITGKAPSKRTTLARVVATDVYLDQIWRFIVQYVSEARWKLELGTICKGSCNAWPTSEKVSQFTGN